MLKKYYQDLNVVRKNTVNDRAFYIPCDKNQLTDSKTDNFRVQMLNGLWEFHYFDSVSDFCFTPDSFDTIEVPSNWQNLGYDRHHYTNQRYPFPYDPPYMPKQNPCGLYKRDFHVNTGENKRFFLNLEGVDSCHYIYINGEFVGYSQVSHSTAEYEITDFVSEGHNKIEVVVLKWCDGSYAEAQDKFRMSGIFRDVYILERPKAFVFDYKYKTVIGKDTAEVHFTFDDLGENIDKNITISLNNELVDSGETNGNTLTLKIGNPKLWTAETPNLYDIKIETADEIILDTIGVREICVKDKTVLLNGNPIKIKGVNRHDSYPDSGYVSSMEQIITDMRIMKQHNVNTIRTSHYPNRPEFYKLCDKYGFYCIDEADIESHGTRTSRTDASYDSYGMLPNDERFITTIIDRVQRLVHRDKNRPSVIIWSLGNESGYGICTEKAIENLKQIDDTRLLHYESTLFGEDKIVEESYEPKFADLDMVSRMYCSIEKLESYLENPKHAKPFFMCEYAHAMGNGPGGFKEYLDLFYKYDHLLGGCVWEWCDHVVITGYDENRQPKYGYGGDSGEYPHDGNFCMDGLVYPNRKPHTGLLEMKNAYQPASIDCRDGKYYVTNRLDFANLGDVVYIKWTMTQNGNKIASGNIDNLDITPRSEAEISINMPKFIGERIYIIFEIMNKKADFLVPKGYCFGFTQFDLSTEKILRDINRDNSAPIQFKEDKNDIFVIGKNFHYIFDSNLGAFSKLEKNGKIITEKAMVYDLYRAPTDNDMYIKSLWKDEGFDKAKPYTYDVAVSQNSNIIEIKCKMSLQVVVMENIANIESVWTINADGDIKYTADVVIPRTKTPLPRFGLKMYMPKSFNNLSYFGYGPHENYADKKVSVYKDRFTSSVKSMHEDYIYPQENGARGGTEELELVSPNSKLTVYGDSFSFNASHYTREELESKMHNHELEESEYTVLNLDYKQDGIGSGSCGPMPLDEYRFSERQFSFSLLFVIE